jgi:hypothetical protein
MLVGILCMLSRYLHGIDTVNCCCASVQLFPLPRTHETRMGSSKEASMVTPAVVRLAGVSLLLLRVRQAPLGVVQSPIVAEHVPFAGPGLLPFHCTVANVDGVVTIRGEIGVPITVRWLCSVCFQAHKRDVEGVDECVGAL